MSTRPKPRPLSRQAEIMLDIFKYMNSEMTEIKNLIGDNALWGDDELEVFAALDAFADEQQEQE